MKKYEIGCKILIINGIMIILAGLYMVFLNRSDLFIFFNNLVDPVFWGNASIPTETLNFKTFTWNYIGMLHILWGIFIIYCVKNGLMKKEKWVWNCLLLTLIIWFINDVYFTVTFKFYKNIIAILVTSILFIIPMIMTSGRGENIKK